jgi:hypothetical protein
MPIQAPHLFHVPEWYREYLSVALHQFIEETFDEFGVAAYLKPYDSRWLSIDTLERTSLVWGTVILNYPRISALVNAAQTARNGPYNARYVVLKFVQTTTKTFFFSPKVWTLFAAKIAISSAARHGTAAAFDWLAPATHARVGGDRVPGFFESWNSLNPWADQNFRTRSIGIISDAITLGVLGRVFWHDVQIFGKYLNTSQKMIRFIFGSNTAFPTAVQVSRFQRVLNSLQSAVNTIGRTGGVDLGSTLAGTATPVRAANYARSLREAIRLSWIDSQRPARLPWRSPLVAAFAPPTSYPVAQFAPPQTRRPVLWSTTAQPLATLEPGLVETYYTVEEVQLAGEWRRAMNYPEYAARNAARIAELEAVVSGQIQARTASIQELMRPGMTLEEFRAAYLSVPAIARSGEGAVSASRLPISFRLARGFWSSLVEVSGPLAWVGTGLEFFQHLNELGDLNEIRNLPRAQRDIAYSTWATRREAGETPFWSNIPSYLVFGAGPGYPFGSPVPTAIGPNRAGGSRRITASAALAAIQAEQIGYVWNTRLNATSRENLSSLTAASPVALAGIAAVVQTAASQLENAINAFSQGHGALQGDINWSIGNQYDFLMQLQGLRSDLEADIQSLYGETPLSYDPSTPLAQIDAALRAQRQRRNAQGRFYRDSPPFVAMVPNMQARFDLAMAWAMARVQQLAAPATGPYASGGISVSGGRAAAYAPASKGREFWLYRGRDRDLMLQTLRDLLTIGKRDELAASGVKTKTLSTREPIFPDAEPGLSRAVAAMIQALEYGLGLVRKRDGLGGYYSLSTKDLYDYFNDMWPNLAPFKSNYVNFYP